MSHDKRLSFCKSGYTIVINISDNAAYIGFIKILSSKGDT